MMLLILSCSQAAGWKLLDNIDITNTDLKGRFLFLWLSYKMTSDFFFFFPVA